MCTNTSSCIQEYLYNQSYRSTCEWKSFSHVRLFVTPWIVAHLALLCPWDSPGKNTGVGGHYQHRIMNINFILGIRIQYFFSILNCSRFGTIGNIGSLLNWLQCHFAIASSLQDLVLFLSISLLSNITRYSRLIVYISCSNPRNTSFNQMVLIRILETKIWALGMPIATGMFL